MKIHTAFTFYHFIAIALVLFLLIIVLLKHQLKEFITLWDPWILIFSLIITCLSGFYQEGFCSGMYCGKRYGFPRQIFDMAHYLGKDQVDVRVVSKMHWDYFFQNFVLIFLLLNLIKSIFKK